jgi:hypothetical protein
VTTVSKAVSEKDPRQARSGNSDSGTWSNPIALLLGGSFIRRFKKLEKRSPAIAALPINAPVLHPRPVKSAPITVANIERIMPRMVFDAPNKGCPSRHLAPPSRGRENRLPKTFFATTGIALASTTSNSSRVITQSRIPYAISAPIHGKIAAPFVCTN